MGSLLLFLYENNIIVGFRENVQTFLGTEQISNVHAHVAEGFLSHTNIYFPELWMKKCLSRLHKSSLLWKLVSKSS
eukprot:g36285.t1